MSALSECPAKLGHTVIQTYNDTMAITMHPGYLSAETLQF